MNDTKVWTSCFSRVRLLPKPDLFTTGIEPVAISRGIPRWFKGRRELRLAPAREKLWIPDAEFVAYYDDLLNSLDPRQLWEDLTEGGRKAACLLCWEKPGEPCHRQTVAEWFERHLGIVVPEWGGDIDSAPPHA
ncbi:MAG TPA: DUF488 family protein [Gemmataceae bacterium]|nr:DUF488 family protein [Gemmataceae bacterium]